MGTDFERYGWKVDETNLATLPPTAPQSAKNLTTWLTLEGRRSSLEEWIGCFSEETGRIHGKFWHIGAWSGRMSHSNPNQANIYSPFHGDPKNPVEEVKAKYDRDLRALFTVPKDAYLVGTDLDGAQLRVLACVTKSEKLRDSILSGDKKAGTDIHSMNMKALGPVCKNRDVAKTFVYGFLLGASVPKVAEILSCNTKQASDAVEKFLNATPELKYLKKVVIPKDASRGYFVGLDGRKVLCNSEHLMLAGYLQNGEAVIAKHWVVKWRRMATEAGIWYKHVDFVHDEVQVEVKTKEDGERLIQIQRDAMIEVNTELDLFCPMDIEGKIGKNWADSH